MHLGFPVADSEEAFKRRKRPARTEHVLDDNAMMEPDSGNPEEEVKNEENVDN